MKKIFLAFMAVCSLGLISSVFAKDCGCKGSAEKCTCAECHCPSCK